MNRLELLWGESFFAGSLAQLIARLTGLPAVVLLLTVGLVIGKAGLNLVEPESLGRGLQPLVGLLVSLVLFDGGLNLRLAGRDLQRTVVQLVVVRGVQGLLGGTEPPRTGLRGSAGLHGPEFGPPSWPRDSARTSSTPHGIARTRPLGALAIQRLRRMRAAASPLGWSNSQLLSRSGPWRLPSKAARKVFISTPFLTPAATTAWANRS